MIFDPHMTYLNVFQLKNESYQLIESEEDGRYFLEDLQIYLAIEQHNQLRLFNIDGIPVLSTAEWASLETQRAKQETQRAEQEAQRAEQEAQLADAALSEIERLKALLSSAGIDSRAI
ncbi:MAG: hypothetical protein HQM12_08765 [SAR324 cluster bacterium]|nr:hypothetical protein [SAR324 cluster bacterium]